MKDEPYSLKEMARKLKRGFPELVSEVDRILALDKAFGHNHDRYVRLLKGECDKRGVDLSERELFDPYGGDYPFPGIAYLTHIIRIATIKTGKSVAMEYEAGHLMERGVKVLFLDMQNEYTHMALGRDLHDAWPGMLRINLLERHGNESPEDVAIRLVTNAREAFYLRDMAENILFEETVRTIEKYGDNATIFHLIRELSGRSHNVRERSYGSVETNINRLRRMVTELPHTFSCTQGFPLDFFLHKNVVFPVKDISPYITVFLFNHILQLMAKHKGLSDKLDNLIVVEECQSILNRERQERFDLGEIFILRMMRMVARKIGCGFMLLSQSLSSLPLAVTSVANTAFIGRLLSGSCVRMAKDRLSLDEDEAQALLTLPDRHFLVQLPESGEAFELEVPLIERPKYDPREVESVSRERLTKIPFIPFDRRELENNKPKPDTAFLDLLRDYFNRPFVGSERRYKDLGISSERMEKLTAEQERSGLIERGTFGIGKGQPKQSALLTPEGLGFLKVKHEDYLPGKGSLLHRFCQMELHRVIGNSVIEEGECDLVQHLPGGLRICWEVELDPANDHFLENIKRNAPLATRVVALNKDGVKALQRKAKERLRLEVLENVTFMTIQEALSHATH